MNRKDRILQRNSTILLNYENLRAIKEHGVQKHSYEWIVATLAQKYYLAPFTIEEIILNHKTK